MNFETYFDDELLIMRIAARKRKDWALSDKIRDYLDSRLVFVFDVPGPFQEVHWACRDTFKNKPEQMTNRQYLEYKIQEDIRANKMFDAWLYSIQNKR